MKINKRIKSALRLFIFLGLTTFTVSIANADGDLVFICHPGEHYSKVDIKRVFTGRNEVSRPVDNRPLKSKFLEQIDISPGKYFITWKKNYFRRGTLLPALRDNDAAVIDYVKNQPGALGYISSSPLSNSGVEICGN